MNGWNFSRAALLAGALLLLRPAGAQEPTTKQRPAAELGQATEPGRPADPAAAKRERRPLDRRVHRGYEGWERLIPTHVKAQYAGGMGLLSLGCGWDYGRKCRWETDLSVGVLPGAWSDRTHTVFALRQNYIPWSIRCCRRLSVEPLAAGIYLTLITGEQYWVREPDKYPSSRYYGFTSRLRPTLYVGQRLTYHPKSDGPVRGVTLYYELSANDLDIVAKCGNKTLGLSQIVRFSCGVKLQLLR